MSVRWSSNSRIIRLVSVLISVLLITQLLSFHIYADESDLIECLSVSSDWEFSVEADIIATWPGHANVELSFINTGNEKIEDWYFIFESSYRIDDIWNARIVECVDNTCLIGYSNWNRDIDVGSCITVGMTVSSYDGKDITDLPNRFILDTKRETISSDCYTVNYIEYSRWDEGFTGALIIEALEDINSWSLSALANEDITVVSGAIVSEDDFGRTMLSNDGNTRDMLSGSSFYISIQGQNITGCLELTDIVITGTCPEYTLTEDDDKNGIPDYLEIVGIMPTIPPTPTETPIPTAEPSPTPAITETTATVSPTPSTLESPTCTSTPLPTLTTTLEPTVTCFPTDTITPSSSLEPTITVSTPIPTLTEEEYWTDTDGDRLYDGEEEYYGTDRNNPDSDYDGIPDFDEIVMDYNPLSPDSNRNGISDGNEDEDRDGLSNISEIQYGTCCFAADSDYDGINDPEELSVYNTDPRNEDSDEDGVTDGDEVVLGKDPADGSDGDIRFEQTIACPVENTDDPAITCVRVTTMLPGLIDHEIEIRDMYNVDIYSTEAYGRVGSPISIESSISIEAATIVFEYCPDALGEAKESDLIVLWYDEEHNVYDIQEQAVIDQVNNTISLDVTHFSTYMVVDRVKWDNPLEPDNSDFIITAEYETEYIAWRDREPSLEYMERDSFIWWGFSHPGDYVILQTLVAEKSCPDEGNNLEHWTYRFVWLVMDATDNDGDGIPDECEEGGTTGTNKRNYHSDSNSSDSDGDGISDGDETGPIYILYRGENGRDVGVIRDGEIVYCNNYGRFPSDSPFYYLDEYIPEPGQYRRVSGLSSNPMMSDSDGDGYDDSSDFIPHAVNRDVVYLFTNPDFYDSACVRKKLYEEHGLKVIFGEFEDKSSFTRLWDSIGTKGDISDYNRYFYNAQSVVLCSHGSASTLDLGMTGQYPDMLYSSSFNDVNGSDTRFVNPNDLSPRIIESLNIYACECGKRRDDGRCIAEDFIYSQQGISQVIAADTNLIGRNGQYYFRAYNNLEVLSADQFHQLQLNLYSGTDSREYQEYRNIGRICDETQGFIVFKDDGSTYDYYSDDVLYGSLYVNYDDQLSGIFIYDISPLDALGNAYHDPVIE